MLRVLLLLVVMLMSVRPTFAATFTVTNTSNAGAGSLRKAVDDANLAAGADEIVFNTAGTFSVPRTITLDTPLEIRGSLTITAPTNVAQRVTIRGSATGTRLINVTVSGLGLTLRDLVFENAKVLTVGDAGGVLFAGADIILTLIAERCIFQNNQAAQEGAALSLQVGVVTLTDCTFRNNTALFSAAIDFAESGDAAGFTTLMRCVFENNVSSRVGGSNGRFGSVITQENGNLSAVDCTFTNNTGELAAVYCGVFGGAGRFDVTDSIFEDNDGGCLSAFSNAVTLTGCRFERNGTILRSSDGGGDGLVMTDCVGLNNTGLLLWPSGIVVEDCRFDDNGGGIVGNAELYRVKMRRNAGITNGTLIAEDCDFDSNTGGGFEVSLYNRLEMRRCAITRNVGTLENVPSTNSPPLVAHTPTLMVAGHITLESCTVSDNSGIVQAAEEAKFYNCTFSNNSVGITPLIYIGPTPPYSGLRPPVTLQNCVFSLNGNGTTKIIAANYRDNNGYAIKSLGGNFIDLTDFLSWGQAGIGPHATDQVAVTGNARLDAKLGPLLDWGGAGLSRMPLAGSPLTDTGNVAPAAPEYQEPIKDQTGRNRVRGVKVDIGAVETRSRLVVTNTNDSGAGSLREAVSLANGLPDAEIVFEDATFGTTPKTITLTSGQIIVLSSLTMTGPEIGVAISGGDSSRILSIIGSN